jgi:hypothetical protein
MIMGLEGTFHQTCRKYVGAVMAWDFLDIRHQENVGVINEVCH